jgi:UDP-N-acetylmuramate--alanine ligase
MISGRKFKLHFVGIGGIGMSGIAEIFLSQGHTVSGSDLASNETTERLVRMGAMIVAGHSAENIGDVDVVVTSSAVRADNPEVIEAKKRRIPVIPRAEMLAEIMRGKIGVAIAGTHGKTTTTSMTAQILMQAGLDPTVVVGGKVEAIGSNAKVGTGSIVVAEADESDGSYHLLPATYAVVTNIDTDHMEFYHNRENLNDAFVKFTKQIPFYGCTWLCGDDSGVKAVLPLLTKPYFTYGFELQNDLVVKNLRVIVHGMQKFEVWKMPAKDQAHVLLGEVELSVLGKHNVLNSLAALGVSMSIGASFESVTKALLHFKHVRRRFDERYHSVEKNIRVIDDYGHHPTEIKAVLSTARQTGHKRIITVFQPHRYTRTQLCWNEFLSCFQDSDVLLMLPIYAANEDPIEGVSTPELCHQLRLQFATEKNGAQILSIETLQDAEDWVAKNITDGDLILTLGAGSITKLGDSLAAKLKVAEV